jgi:Flp pilus assembly protein TadD
MILRSCRGHLAWRREILIALLLAATCLVAFLPLTRSGFVNFDDEVYVTKNPHVQVGLSPRSAAWALTTLEAGNWHPLTWLSLELDSQFYGPRAWGFHLSNLLFHIANSLLLFAVFRWMTGALWRSALVASLFALHPLHVESVAWISERKDVASTFFWMLTLLAYIWYVQRPGNGRFVLVAISLVCGLLAKPMLVTLPCVLLLLDYWPLGRFAQRGYVALLVEKVPLFVLAAASSAITVVAQSRGGAIITADQLPAAYRLGNAMTAYGRYMGKMLWPQGLAVLYPFAPADKVAWQGLLAALILAGVSYLFLSRRRDYPYLAVGWLWYAGTLVPVIGLVQVGIQALADRYTYVPLIGLFVIVAWGLADLTATWQLPRAVPVALAALALGGCACCTWVQAGYWRDSIVLWRHTLEVTRDNYAAHYSLALAQGEAGHDAEAIDQLERAIRIKPNYALAYNNLGVIYARQGKDQMAIEEFARAVRCSPDYAPARVNLGQALMKAGNLEQAKAEFRAALSPGPHLADAQRNLGQALTRQGQCAEAERHLSEALRIKPDDPGIHVDLAMNLKKQGKLAEAVKEYNIAVALQPDNAEAHNNLAVIFAQQGDFQRAIEECAQAARSNPQDADVLCNCGTIYNALGDFEQAGRRFEEAVRLQPRCAKYRYNLAYALDEQGHGEAARQQYRSAYKLDAAWPLEARHTAWVLATHPDPQVRNPSMALQLAKQASEATGGQQSECLDALAAAYANAGRFEQAAATARKAVRLAESAKRTEYASQLRERLRLYEGERPYREQPGLSTRQQ